MLNIDFRPTFTRTATFRIPSGRGFDEQTCEVSFAALTITELNGYDVAEPAGLKALLERVVVGLEEVVDGNGAAVPYTPELRARIIDHDWGRQGLYRAYVIGRQQAAEGN